MEHKIKQVLGDLAFQIVILQTQLEEANKRIKELEDNGKTDTE
jgi:hypothetical protein